MLTNHPPLVSKSRMCKTYFSSPPISSVACSGTALAFNIASCLRWIKALCPYATRTPTVGFLRIGLPYILLIVVSFSSSDSKYSEKTKVKTSVLLFMLVVRSCSLVGGYQRFLQHNNLYKTNLLHSLKDKTPHFTAV
jgi:hypothetical protein